MDSNQNKSYEDDDINTYYNQGNEDDVNYQRKILINF